MTHRPQRDRSPEIPTAFTLIELLVVIVIIGILAALLLTAVSKVKVKAHQTACVNNLRQLALASYTYTTDTGRPVGREDPDYPGGNWMGTLIDYYEADEVRVCPAAPLRKPTPGPGEINGQGTADKAWVRWTTDGKTMFYGSYGYNAWLYDIQHREDKHRFLNAEQIIQKPTKTPVFVDANWVDLFPLANEPPWPNLYKGKPFPVSNGGIGRCTIARHGAGSPSSAPREIQPGQELPGSINMSLFDGHVETVKLEDLWNYEWHRDWQVPNPRPQLQE